MGLNRDTANALEPVNNKQALTDLANLNSAAFVEKYKKELLQKLSWERRIDENVKLSGTSRATVQRNAIIFMPGTSSSAIAEAFKNQKIRELVEKLSPLDSDESE